MRWMQQLPRRLLLVASSASSTVNFRGPLIKAAIASGWMVGVCAPFREQEAVRRNVETLGTLTFDCPIANTFAPPWADTRAWNRIRWIVDRFAPTVILAYTVKPLVLTALIPRGARTYQKVGWLTGLGFLSAAANDRMQPSAILAKMLGRSLRRFDGLLVQNSRDRQVVQERRWRRPDAWLDETPGSGVDVSRFRPSPLPSVARVGMLARLVESKGVGDYIAAARMIKSLHPHIECHLGGREHTGPGAFPVEFVRKAHEEGVITYWGHVADPVDFLSRLSVYVLPSYYPEGQPRSVLEALSTGRPVVTCDTPGCRETIVDGVHGQLVPPRDPESLAAALLRLSLNPLELQRMSRAARERAVSVYDAERVARQVLDAIEQVDFRSSDV